MSQTAGLTTKSLDLEHLERIERFVPSLGFGFRMGPTPLAAPLAAPLGTAASASVAITILAK